MATAFGGSCPCCPAGTRTISTIRSIAMATLASSIIPSSLPAALSRPSKQTRKPCLTQTAGQPCAHLFLSLRLARKLETARPRDCEKTFARRTAHIHVMWWRIWTHSKTFQRSCWIWACRAGTWWTAPVLRASVRYWTIPAIRFDWACWSCWAKSTRLASRRRRPPLACLVLTLVRTFPNPRAWSAGAPQVTLWKDAPGYSLAADAAAAPGGCCRGRTASITLMFSEATWQLKGIPLKRAVVREELGRKFLGVRSVWGGAFFSGCKRACL
mmetsp:Transcript_7281/g.17601  ORF Transcript_7281/g.17601 Transcript_7281/m.17601 type:complete len:270 (+) Transcript_7281:265-1074(+)